VSPTKKELGIANLVVDEKAAKLNRVTLGVAVGQGPWQWRLEEIGGTKPLAFGQFGEMGPGLEAPALASVAKRGDQWITVDQWWKAHPRRSRGQTQATRGVNDRPQGQLACLVLSPVSCVLSTPQVFYTAPVIHPVRVHKYPWQAS
jgi:hypothetical protein